MNFIIPLQIWYSENKRVLPWRETTEAYNIWISEIIFQQTRINQGISYYINFINKFPDIKTLAEASEDEVLHAWQGLGYYSRAHNLHFTAKIIQNELNGVFPSSYSEILKLKGIGKYTAAAIASISFHEKVPAIDGNAFRVYSRILNSDKDISKTTTFKFFFETIKPWMPDNPGDLNQAVMDLGSAICTPTNPKCEECPVRNLCKAYECNTQNVLPVKTTSLIMKKESLHYAFINYSNQTLIQKRDKNSIWKGLYEFPHFNHSFTEYTIQHNHKTIHKLTHKILEITISEIIVGKDDFENISKSFNLIVTQKDKLKNFAFPKPIEKFLFHI